MEIARENKEFLKDFHTQKVTTLESTAPERCPSNFNVPRI